MDQMGWFLISRHALGQFAKLLLEVSVYECGCSLRFVSVGSNIVATSAHVRTKRSAWTFWPMCRADIIRFDCLIRGVVTMQGRIENQERCEGLNTQSFVFQNKVRSKCGQNLLFDFAIAVCEAVASRRGKVKGLFRQLQALCNQVSGIPEHLLQCRLLFQESHPLTAVFLIGKQAAISIVKCCLQRYQIVNPPHAFLICLLLPLNDFVSKGSLLFM